MNERITDLDKRYKNKQDLDSICRRYNCMLDQMKTIANTIAKLEAIVTVADNAQTLNNTVLCEGDILEGDYNG